MVPLREGKKKGRKAMRFIRVSYADPNIGWPGPDWDNRLYRAANNLGQVLVKPLGRADGIGRFKCLMVPIVILSESKIISLARWRVRRVEGGYVCPFESCCSPFQVVFELTLKQAEGIVIGCPPSFLGIAA